MLSRLSRHFVHNWRLRVGGEPSLETVRQVVRDSVKVQHCKDLVDAAGQVCRQLAIYWHPELQIIITVDHISEMAVSVLSRHNDTRGACTK